MKTTKWFILSLFLLLSVSMSAQNKTNSGFKITMEFEGETNPKIYECSNVYYRKDAPSPEGKTNIYELSVNCYGIADSKQLEWISNPKLLKTLKITVLKSGKKEREFLLKNASVVSYGESWYKTDEPDGSNSSFDFSITAEQISINGLQMKQSK